MSKKLVSIGDVFGTWTIIALEENDRKYNYNYVCRCSCGAKRVIRKDKLVNMTFPKCDKCLSNGLIASKMNLIQQSWNFKLNGSLIESKLDVNKIYSWICPQGHTYYKNIIALNNNCPKCDAIANEQSIVESLNKHFNSIVDYLDIVCDEVFDEVNINIEEQMWLIRIEIDGVIVLMIPSLHKKYNPIIHKSKETFYEVIQSISSLKRQAIDDNREHIFLDIDMNKKDFDKIISVLGIVKRK